MHFTNYIFNHQTACFFGITSLISYHVGKLYNYKKITFQSDIYQINSLMISFQRSTHYLICLLNSRISGQIFVRDWVGEPFDEDSIFKSALHQTCAALPLLNHAILDSEITISLKEVNPIGQNFELFSTIAKYIAVATIFVDDKTIYDNMYNYIIGTDNNEYFDSQYLTTSL